LTNTCQLPSIEDQDTRLLSFSKGRDLSSLSSDPIDPSHNCQTNHTSTMADHPTSAYAAAADQHSSDLQEAGYNASAAALDHLTTQARDPAASPLEHIHTPATHPNAHAWLSKILPQSTVANLETRFHMGNYVLDRQTHEKTFEAMSIYVRLGMHMLYYGSEQEKLLHWNKTLKLLEDESVKMGAQYDDPASKEHIVPFIRSFNLDASMQEMERPDPSQYTNFNDFFARAIRADARPIAEPENELVTSSPADCRLTAFPTVDLATKYWIKGSGFTLARLLGDEALAKVMDGGSMVIARLAPQDYHNWHSPVSGVVDKVLDIKGAYYTVNPQVC
jgi:phosphatidylserine decarboxylase